MHWFLYGASALSLIAAATPVAELSPSNPAQGENKMLYSVDSGKTLVQLREDLPKACQAHKFGVLNVIDLKQKMREKGVDYAGDCLIFEVCNPQKAKQVLEANPEISTALPCRISVFKTKDGKTRLSTIRPAQLLELYGAAGLKEVAIDVEQALTAIMNEAAR